LSWYLQFFRDTPRRAIRKHLRCVKQYGELYRPIVRGEATASYAALDVDVIEDIVALNPDVKVIVMIRNPVDRAWSEAKNNLLKHTGRSFAEVSEDEFKRFFDLDYQRRCAQYVQNIDNWNSCLKDGNLYVGLFDDVKVRPEGLLADVMSFLGIRSECKYIDGRFVRRQVNPTDNTRIPDSLRSHLQALLEPDLTNLEQRYGLTWL
jgi:hypothetical protein